MVALTNAVGAACADVVSVYAALGWSGVRVLI